jgi:hypothetical protein
VQEDSAGLLDYYDRYKYNYLSKKSIEGKIYTLRESGGGKRLEAAYKKYSRKTDTDEKLKEKFNRKGDTLLTVTEGKWFTGDDPDIDRIKWTPGIHSYVKNGFPSLINLKKINEPEPLPFNEVQAEIISGYQEWLTEEWVKQLKGKYTVEIDDLVFKEVKKRLGNE